MLVLNTSDRRIVQPPLADDPALPIHEALREAIEQDDADMTRRHAVLLGRHALDWVAAHPTPNALGGGKNTHGLL